MRESFASVLFSQLALPLCTLATLQLNDSSFVQSAEIYVRIVLWEGGVVSR